MFYLRNFYYICNDKGVYFPPRFWDKFLIIKDLCQYCEFDN